MGKPRGQRNAARQKEWPGAHASKERAFKRHQATVQTVSEAENLEHVRMLVMAHYRAYYQVRASAVDLEDLLQTAHLVFYELPEKDRTAAGDLFDEVIKPKILKAVRADVREAVKEGHFSIDAEEENDEGDDWEDRNQPRANYGIERPDWIPESMAERTALILQCSNLLDSVYVRRANKRDGTGGWNFRLRINGYYVTSAGYPSEGGARKAGKTALRKIIGWCCPVNEYDVTHKSKKVDVEVIRWSNYWATYKATASGEEAIDLIDAKEHFLGVPACFWADGEMIGDKKIFKSNDAADRMSPRKESKARVRRERPHWKQLRGQWA